MPVSDWIPSAGAVGSILRARTKDTQGNELGTFTAATRPTEDQVASLILSAAGDLASAVGADLPEELWSSASTVASYKAAMLVELSYYPEQVASGRSPYEQLRELYLEALRGLTDATGGGDTPGGTPAYAFPVSSSLDAILGPTPGGYVVPYGGGLYQ